MSESLGNRIPSNSFFQGFEFQGLDSKDSILQGFDLKDSPVRAPQVPRMGARPPAGGRTGAASDDRPVRPPATLFPPAVRGGGRGEQPAGEKKQFLSTVEVLSKPNRARAVGSHH